MQNKVKKKKKKIKFQTNFRYLLKKDNMTHDIATVKNEKRRKKKEEEGKGKKYITISIIDISQYTKLLNSTL